eukprot:15433377-Alexandrium_andersonii.AAC.1
MGPLDIRRAANAPLALAWIAEASRKPGEYAWALARPMARVLTLLGTAATLPQKAKTRNITARLTKLLNLAGLPGTKTVR